MQQDQNQKVIKVPYTISCSSEFRDKINELAQKYEMNVGDLARSTLLLFPKDVIENYKDPGEPEGEDREEITIRRGATAGRVWRRKPRLQMRLMKGVQLLHIRKALQLFYDISTNQVAVQLLQAENTRLNASASESIQDIEKALKGGFVVEKREKNVHTRLNQEQVATSSVEDQAVLKEILFSQSGQEVKDRKDACRYLGFDPKEKLWEEKIEKREDFIRKLYEQTPQGTRPVEDYLAELARAAGFLRGMLG